MAENDGLSEALRKLILERKLTTGNETAKALFPSGKKYLRFLAELKSSEAYFYDASKGQKTSGTMVVQEELFQDTEFID